ncbi:glycoside hydrolase family 5 protein [Dactylosporangium sp. CA-092794]|uniref:glycoside hydrolase family 5 protein n=1 Tax=Dactylosporangium sp. CA-092794 TaxID=3239929 RepID=UPI003D910707
MVPLLSSKKVHPTMTQSGQRSQMPLHAEGSRIVDARGETVTFTGVNWFGLETNTFAPHGLWSRGLDAMLDQMAAQGFNSVRLPFSNELFDAASKPTGIDYSQNPGLQGLTGPQIMDKVVEGATKRGMMVILDRHRPTSQAQSNLWYTDKISEDRWISDWVMLAKRYKNNPLVVGADLHNEPHGEATWGDGNAKTDWQLAAQKAGDAVLKANPNWLIIVEGIEKYRNDGYWWGGNLEGAKDHPVKLSDSSKLVYSAHDYSPKVWSQQWFNDPSFPANMPALWDKQFGYLVKNNTAPVLVGEFGGRSVAEQDAKGGKDLEGIWQRNLVGYLKDNGLSYTYWAWNPNSGDTGGVLKDDWKTIDADKMALLKTYQAPLAAAGQ